MTAPVDYTSGVPEIDGSSQQTFGSAVFDDIGRPYGVSINASGNTVAFLAASGRDASLYTMSVGGTTATRVLSKKDSVSPSGLLDAQTAWKR